MGTNKIELDNTMNKKNKDMVDSMFRELEELYKKKGIEKHYLSFDEAQKDIDELIFESGYLDETLAELKDMEKYPEKYKRYSSFDEALKNLKNNSGHL